MDRATADRYEDIGPKWSQRRGPADVRHALQLRERVGEGLIADIGCGAGRYLDALGPAVIGFDVAAAMLSVAKEFGRPLAQGDLELLPFVDGRFDAVFARHTYLHIPKSSLPAALGELWRVLRPGGQVYLSVIEGHYVGYDLPGDDFPGRFYACWRAAELRSVIEEAGFIAVQSEETPRRNSASDLVVRAQKPLA